MAFDVRHRYIISKVREVFEIEEVTIVENFFINASVLPLVNIFLRGEGESKLIVACKWHGVDGVEEVSHDLDDAKSHGSGGDYDEYEEYAAKKAPSNKDLKKQQALRTAELSLVTVESGITTKCVYFIRVSKSVEISTVEQDLTYGELTDAVFENFVTMLSEVYYPVISRQDDWGKAATDSVREFVSNMNRFVNHASETAKAQVSMILKRPDLIKFGKVRPVPEYACDPDAVKYFEDLVEDWCNQIEKLVKENEQSRKEKDAELGPSSELDYWRTRQAKINGVHKQVASKEGKIVLSVLFLAKSPLVKRWLQIDALVAEAVHEVKDTLKYLAILEKYFETMYTGTPMDIMSALPGLMTNIKIMYTLAQYYSTPDRMTTLFTKITNQITTNCHLYISSVGKLWDQNANALIEKLQSCIKLFKNYQDQYENTKKSLLRDPKLKNFDLDEALIFKKTQIFIIRMEKLIDLFSSISQFNALAEYNLDGMSQLLQNFNAMLQQFKRKTYDLLDTSIQQFDKDYIDFNKCIVVLDESLLDYINNSFDRTNDTSEALKLLKQFQQVFKRNTLKADLETKYAIIFHNYGVDLTFIKDIYENYKTNPHLVRNAPLVAGNIAWARLLLSKIEAPMDKFRGVKSLMQSQDGKSIIRSYNKLVRALVKFEVLWMNAWTKSIDQARASFNATLLARLPETGQIVVNFDQNLSHLFFEAKYLLKLGIAIPEKAKSILVQEERYKYYVDSLAHMLREYSRIMRKIRTPIRAIFRPVLDELDIQIRPGMTSLTWSSLTIEVFVSGIYAALEKLEDMVDKANDIIDHQIAHILQSISSTLMLVVGGGKDIGMGASKSMASITTPPTAAGEAPVVEEEESSQYSLEDFTASYNNETRIKATYLNMKSQELEGTVDHLCKIISTTDKPTEIDPVDKITVKKTYLLMLQEALLEAVKRSLSGLLTRIVAPDSALFEADVMLISPDIVITPTMDEVQNAIQHAANEVVHAVGTVTMWTEVGSSFPMTNFLPLIEEHQDVQVFRSELSEVLGKLREKVDIYLSGFQKFNYMREQDLHATFANFLASNPGLPNFEEKLDEFQGLDKEIATIESHAQIGAISLCTDSLKYALKNEVTQWRTLYITNLKDKTKEKIQSIVDSTADSTKKMAIKINDVDDLRHVMQALAEVRSRESNVERQFIPIEDTLDLLAKHGVPANQIDLPAVQKAKAEWDKLRGTGQKLADDLGKVQKQFKRDLQNNIKVLSADIRELAEEYNISGPMVPGIKPMEAVDRLRRFKVLYEEKESKYLSYTAGEELFGLPKTEQPVLVKMKADLELLDSLYTLYTDVIAAIEEYNQTPWATVSPLLEVISNQLTQYYANCQKLPKQLRAWDAYADLKARIEGFLEVLPLLKSLASKYVKARHWAKVMEVTKTFFPTEHDNLKLSNILSMNLLAVKEDIEEISNAAEKEARIEAKLAEIQEQWSDMAFTFADFKHKGNLILKGTETEAIMDQLEESQTALSAMLSSRHIGPFKEELQTWLTKLSNIGELVDHWLLVQSMWTYLEAVFNSSTIAKQLPLEAKRFQNIDKNWIKIMTRASEVKNVVACTINNEVLKSLLPHLAEQLELCQKSLSGYLESKRLAFPRFFFVSDTVLLEILSQKNDPKAILPHLKTIFDNVYAVTIDSKTRKLTAMQSGEGESVDFSYPVAADGNIEDWLLLLESEMKRTMKDVIRKASRDCFSMKLPEFIEKYCAQAALLGIQFIWTRDVQLALGKSKTEKGIIQSVSRRVGTVMSELTAMAGKELTGIDRTKLETLITIQVHQRDVLEELIAHKVKDPQDFEWQKQCRIYWRTDKDECCVEVADVEFDYSYEYLGCKERLVITPLTDRCYITLTQAMALFLGGSPYGPAGTGKTETVKDLGRTLGKYVVVVNASDQYNYVALGKIFKGVAQSGAWVCFDEFNRIEVEVLSVVAQQVHSILSALRERKKTFTFTDGTQLSLMPTCGIFITMNPGYAGRTELPENIKTLFRGVAMMTPDREIIMKVKLSAQGFHEAPSLAKKFDVLYRLCEEQLSKQPHYDFGLRNISSVLRTAGIKRRAQKKVSEMYALVQALRAVNTPKLVTDDATLFNSLIEDLFPQQPQEKSKYLDVRAAVEAKLKEENLVNHIPWVDKTIELYEAATVRHGIIVVGPSGCGKSKCIDVLLKALTGMATDGVSYKLIRMNPKAITTNQMYGSSDVSNEWTDGIFSSIYRRVNRLKNVNSWVCLDGPVDAIWIESLNSVLDENKTLTLSNGDRLPMMSNVKLIFEVADLNNASPATVSRAGIIYMSASVLGWGPITESWLVTQKSGDTPLLRALFDKYMDEAGNYVSKECKPIMNIALVNQVQTCQNLLASLLQNRESTTKEQMEKLFLFSLIWSVGSLLTNKERKAFSDFLKKLAGNNFPSIPSPEDSLYEYYVNETSMEWEHWQVKVPPWKFPKVLEFTSVFVPTIDTTRIQYLMDLLIRTKKSVLLVGEAGTAKTATVRQYLTSLSSGISGGKGDNSSAAVSTAKRAITFSAATTPLIFQRFIEANIEKRQARTYGPVGGATVMNIFLDDVSTPEKNEWGDQNTSELLRQLIDDEGFYNLDKPGEWLSINGLQFIGAMAQPGGEKNDLPDRIKRHFGIFGMNLPADNVLDNIFGSIIRGHFTPESFNPEVAAAAKLIVPCSIEVWHKVRKTLLPTPGKVHYIFNLRELSRVIQGILSSPSSVVTKPSILLGLWRHEMMRVFADKFTTVDDKTWFEEELNAAVERASGAAKEKDKKPGAKGTDKPFDIKELPQYFTDFMRLNTKDDNGDEVTVIDMRTVPKVYEPITGWPAVREMCEKYMDLYNEKFVLRKLDLVMFEDAMKHLMRISRILRTPRGNALLVGVGGSGKQSLTKLASYIAGYQTFQLAVNKSYGVPNLLEDLKRLYRTTGALGQPVAFIITDNDVKNEIFLDYINQILSSGEIPNLLPKDEIDMLISEMRSILKDDGPGQESYDKYYNQLIGRVRDNLHVVLSFSPGDKLKQRIRKFPCLISECTVDWFLPWPKDALLSVASKYISEFTAISNQNIKGLLPAMMAGTHDTIEAVAQQYFLKFRRHIYITPKSYLSFIHSFKHIYQKTYIEINSQITKLGQGLEKLRQAADDVQEMKEVLAKKEEQLEQAQKFSSELLASITQSTAKAEKKKAEITAIKNQLAENAEVVGRDRDQAEREVAEFKPELEKAMAQVKLIKASDITTMRNLRNPPDLIRRIADAIIIVKNYGPLEPVQMVEVAGKLQPKDSWPTAQLMMVNSSFLPSLLNFESDNVNEETLELLAPYLEMPDFTYEDAKRSSLNVAALLGWVRAQHVYKKVTKNLAPKLLALQDAEARLGKARRQLQGIMDELAAQQLELNRMKKEFDTALQEKQKVQDEAEYTRKRMEAADSLIKSLGSEKIRWSQQSIEINETLQQAIGNSVVASAFISYCGAFNMEFREHLLETFFKDCKSLGLPISDNIHQNVVKFLVDDAIVGEWNLQSLPTDALSVQNGLITTSANRWPILIDPQGQGLAWILKREKANGLVVTRVDDKYFLQQLEDCLTNGKSMLIDLIDEEVDPILDPLLDKQIIKSGRSFKIVISDKEMDYNEGFKLFMTTRLNNPHYSPELSARTTVIDFTVTSSGLESQLLGHVVLKERAALEEQRYTLLSEINSNSKMITQLQDDLLGLLSKSEGNLLDNSALIDVLANTKKMVEEVSEKLAVSSETEKKINIAREEYRPVAKRGSVLYFLMSEINLVNHMYHTSLAQFMTLFDNAIKLSEKNQVPGRRIANIIEYLTFSSFQYCMRGLFQQHRQVFLLLLAIRVAMSCGDITPLEFSSFVKGGAALDIKAVAPKPREWITDKAWLNVMQMSKIEAFKSFPEMLVKNEQMWKTWYELEAPESKPFPDAFDQRLTRFQRLLLVRGLREDRTMLASTTFIADTLGQRYIEPVPLNLDAISVEASCRTPVVFLLSPGSDPSSLIEGLSRKNKKDLRSISMGQGQEVQARKLLQEGIKSGGWVLLQNCHLGLKFLPEVEDTLVKTEEINPDFRLWITTEPHHRFPVSLLQCAVKLTNETDAGIKAGLKRSFNWVNQDMLDSMPRKEWGPMLYTMCFIHSVVQERRKFGPLGWNIPYEINQADLETAVQFLQNLFILTDFKKGGLSWVTLKFMICEVIYGGKISDKYDRRQFNTYGNLWLGNQMFEPTFTFFKEYTIPQGQDINIFRNAIEKLPLSDTPELFGLHANADITYRTKQSQQVLSTILDIQPKDSAVGSGATREATVAAIADDLISKLPADFQRDTINEKLRKLAGGLTAPLNIFLSQELDAIQAVVSLVRSSLSELKLAIAGTISTSTGIREVLDSLYDARVPRQWTKISYYSTSLGNWFSELLQRKEQLTKWLNVGPPNVYWLGGLFNPGGFFTAVKQQTTRSRQGMPLDGVVLQTFVTNKEKEQIKEPPQEGVYVYGLYLEGCAWSKSQNRLVESAPKVLFHSLPVLHVTAVLESEKKLDPNTYVCPCYRNPLRTDRNFIFNVDLRSEEEPAKWALQGVALCCTDLS